ncbi:MAG: hypothetical protein ACREU2_02565 [Steroidobacteraceae bacterium]
MKYLPRVIAVIALAALVFWPSIYTTGSRAARARPMSRPMSRALGVTGVPADSDYIRSVYARAVGTDADAVLREALMLSLAGQRQQSKLLERFFAYCSVQRFIGENAACTNQTVRAAVDRAPGLSPGDKWPIGGELESKLAEALTFSLANEPLLRRSTDQTTWSTLTYEGPGLLGYNRQVKGAYVLLAVRNQSSWEMVNLVVRLRLPSSHSAPIALECSTWAVPFPFSSPRVLRPQSEAIVYCDPPRNIALGDLLAAVKAAQQQPSLAIQIEEFTLEEPLVTVADDGAPLHQFTAHVVRNVSFMVQNGNRPRTEAEVIDRELAGVTCSQLSTCPSLFQSASLALFGLFAKVPLVALPIIVGLLMGLCVGGFFRRTLLFGGIAVALVLVCTIGGYFYALHQIFVSKGEHGFALLGMVKLAQLGVIAFVLWLPALFIGVQITKPLWALAERRT